MNRETLTKAVAERTNLTEKDASAFIKAFIGVVTDALAKNEDVTLVGFGTFKTTKRAAKEGRNPATGEEMSIPERTVPVFRPGKTLKEAVYRGA